MTFKGQKRWKKKVVEKGKINSAEETESINLNSPLKCCWNIYPSKIWKVNAVFNDVCLFCFAVFFSVSSFSFLSLLFVSFLFFSRLIWFWFLSLKDGKREEKDNLFCPANGQLKVREKSIGYLLQQYNICLSLWLSAAAV